MDAAIEQGNLGGERYLGQWHDVGTPERLRQLDAVVSSPVASSD
jgi:NDP-sugar pyrophosphorylase family protein